MKDLECLQDHLSQWASVSGRRAFLRWAARHSQWTISASDDHTGKAFAWTGQPDQLERRFREWQ